MSGSCETSWTLWSQRWHLAWVSACLIGKRDDCMSLPSDPGHIPLTVLLWRRFTPEHLHVQHATCCSEQIILPSGKAPCDSAGIDKPNIRRIIHYGAPATLQAYYQQARPQILCTCCPRRVFTALRE